MTRKIQGAPLFDLQLVQGHIADMALDVDAAALLIYRAAWTKDSGAPRVTREAAMAKLFATDQAQDRSSTRPCNCTAATVCAPGQRQSKNSIARSAPCASTKGASDVQKIIIARQALGAFQGD